MLSKGYVYIIECDGYHKIGCTTTTVEERLASFKTGNPKSLRCTHLITCVKYPCQKIESYLHYLSKPFKVSPSNNQQEWFKLGTEYLTWLQSFKYDVDLFKN